MFCAASGLSIYSDDHIAMTIGSRPQGILEQAGVSSRFLYF
jgi:hypothetical protein